MTCPDCGSNDVTVQTIEAGSKTKKGGNGLGGNIYNATRGILAVSTLGLSNIVMPKAKGKNKTKTILQKTCICQNSGNSWVIK